MKEDLEQLILKYQKEGQDIKDALSKRGAWDGWYKTLSDLYPDNAHFVFELLQNAEDANATKVKFELKNETLTFKHDGDRDFNADDIDSITTIGDSKKEVNKIGKFGIGFKSVNVGRTQISGIEFSVNGQGKINNNLTINVLAGYTYMNSKSLEPDKIYAYGYYHGYTLVDGSIADQSYTYRNSSVNDKVLKYRYKHIAKLDAEVVYKKISLGGSFRYNDFMQNMDWIFSTTLINGGTVDNPLRDDPSTYIDPDAPVDESYEGMIPGINAAREKFKGGDFIIDIRAGYSLNKQIRLGVIVNNLLNREYMSRPANMMPQRTYAMQLSMKI